MNYDTFFKYWRYLIRSRISAKQVDGSERMLLYMDKHKIMLQQAAYILATAYHETAYTMQPEKERGGRQYCERYDPFPRGLVGKHVAAAKRRARRLGNTLRGDGWKYRGRGLVQITGRNNYDKFNIEDDPDRALLWPEALEILVYGMLDGDFTGHDLGDYVHDEGADYVKARLVVNGRDKNKDIAAHARNFEIILAASGWRH